MRTNEEYKNLEAAKDATIAQQAEQLAALTLALENCENRHVFEAPEGMCFMPENTPEQLAALAEQCKKMREDFCAAINHAVSLGLEADQFLRYWNEGDWDACKEFGFTPSDALVNPLPDIATPALNRIRAEGMRMAAEVCDMEDGTCGMGTVLADKLRASAADLGKTHG